MEPIIRHSRTGSYMDFHASERQTAFRGLLPAEN